MSGGENCSAYFHPRKTVSSPCICIDASNVNDFKARGLDSFKQRLRPSIPHDAFRWKSLTAWEQVGFLPAFRVRAAHWVTDGAALIGDAAHAMNPHASQGRMQAMTDAMVLADVIMKCRNTGDWSAKALSDYETARRPQVAMLQALADEQTTFWNASDAARVAICATGCFGGWERNARLRYQALTATVGLRDDPAADLAG